MINWLTQQWQLMLLAMGFLTRLPVPANLPYSAQRLNHASRYFILIGALVGLIAFGVWFIAGLWLGTELAVLCSMIVTLRLTGCFHEDGLADVCDGFGGGWSVEQKLDIMKDSRLGTYGAVALWAVLTAKFMVLVSIAQQSAEMMLLACVVAHGLSRGAAVLMMNLLPYVQLDQASKVKPLATNMNLQDKIISLTLVVLLGLIAGPIVGVCLLAVVMTVFVLKRWLQRHLAGFTGDCLGAVQQMSELVVYLSLLLLLDHSQFFEPMIINPSLLMDGQSWLTKLMQGPGL